MRVVDGKNVALTSLESLSHQRAYWEEYSWGTAQHRYLILGLHEKVMGDVMCNG
jgi:hypothetical protein